MEVIQQFKSHLPAYGELIINWARPQGWPESPMAVSILFYLLLY